MSIRRFKTAEEIAAEQQASSLTRQKRLPTDKPLLIYARQSTKDQAINNVESAAMQTDDLLQLAIEYGWQQEQITVFVENRFTKDGRLTDKLRNASGKLRIDQRPGLSIVTDKLQRDEAGAVMAWDVSRLFRDEDMVEPAVFARLCKEHHVLVLTDDDMFDFTNGKDAKRFRDEAQIAADYLSKQIGKMNKARARKALLRGEFNGHRLPVGFMLDSEHKNYVPSPHAPAVNTLFKRFRQLNGDFAALRREVVGKPIFPDLPEDVSIGKLHLTKVEGGYTIKSRDGLHRILTNPAYVGYRCWDGRVVNRNAHEPIVDPSDFWFAYNLLADTDLDGLPIEREKPIVRYIQTGTLPPDALLWGKRPSGQAVLTSPGKRVHVQRSRSREGQDRYTIYDATKITLSQEIASIAVRDLDTLFTERLMYRLASDAINRGLRLKDGTPLEERAEGWYAHFRQVQQEAEIRLSTVDVSTEETQKEIARIERRLDVAQDSMSDEDIRKNYEKIRRLRVQLADLEKKQAKQHVSEIELRETAHDVATLPDSWQTMSLERKRRLISLVTIAIELDEITEGWIRVTIHWTPYFQLDTVDVAYIWQQKGAGKRWTEEEIAILHEHYKTASRAWLLEQLPERTWASIRAIANIEGLERPYQREERELPFWMSLIDKQVMDEHDLALEWPRQRHWWKKAVVYNRTALSR